MKYEKEYKETKSQKAFIKLAMKRYTNITKSTARRRFYDMRKKLGTQTPKYHSEEKHKPHLLKMLQYNDLKEYKQEITRKTLTRYGFSEHEINWLEDEADFDGTRE